MSVASPVSLPSLEGRGVGMSNRPFALQSAFTMVEIALCLAIVGFALVAIIGVLPAGLNVQRENREETIINEEATMWMDALRAGGPNDFDANANVFDSLADYVDRVVVSSQNFDQNNAPLGPVVVTVAERGTPRIGDNKVAYGDRGDMIVSLLTTPRVGPPTPNSGAAAAYSTNYVVAYVRAFNGIAAEKPPQDNLDVRDLAFNYRLVVDTTPLDAYDFGPIKTNRIDRTLGQNLADVRLLFRWPLKQSVTQDTPLGKPETGIGRLAFRTQLSGRIEQEPNNVYPDVGFYFLRSRDYVRTK